MLDEEVAKLVQEKVEFDAMHDRFLTAEICGDCTSPRDCNNCRYNNSYSTIWR